MMDVEKQIEEVMDLVSDWEMKSHASGEAQLDAHNPEATQVECAYADFCEEERKAAWEAIRAKLRPLLSSAQSMQPKHATQACNLAPALPVARIGAVYISGPMTGIADFNFPAFNAAAAQLRAQGRTVVNPADHGVIEGAEWADYLRADLAQLVQCDAIYLLPGWSKSRGAMLEHYVAAALGLRVEYADGAEREAAHIANPAPAQGVDAKTIKHISALSELMRMPNAEYFADAHNAAVRHLRALAAQARQGGA